ncbi:hypothetical protein [Nocardia callitridis]|uniref:Uncharacterized protein n=1 Tax=Nocardia callitridis TaxID=648753 RepID=A0ABP9JX21_9NOCA
MSVPDTGQGAARRLYAAAMSTGPTPFRLDGEVAENLAAACDKLVDDLGAVIARGHLVTDVTGFPDLPTGHALTAGFGGKGMEYLDLLRSFQETALLFKAAYLAAGKRFADADAANQAALNLIAQHLETP